MISRILTLITLSVACISCSSIQTASTQMHNSTRQAGAKIKNTITNLTGPSVPIVEVNPQMLKEAKTGDKLAIAFLEKKRRAASARRSFGTPFSFPELDDPKFLDSLQLEELDFKNASLLPDKPAS